MKAKSDTTHRTSRIQKNLSRLSSQPGVYVMKDAKGNVIYIGKARNLKRRLASYFTIPSTGASQLDVKTGILLKKIADFETIITHTEKEALILESNLIKHHRPRYNVILKDDKRYPSLRLDLKSPYPTLRVVRKVKKNGGLFFGPYTSSAAVHKTLKIIHKTFKLRKCKTKGLKNRSRPCLNYQMAACLAPCYLDVDKNQYNEIVKEVILFLKGRTPELIQKIKKEMLSAAKDQNYEKAAILRDKMFALEKTLEKQIAVTHDYKDRDVLGIARHSDSAVIALLFIRGGFLLGKRHFTFPETVATDAEMVGAFIRQYYESAPFVPGEILVPEILEDLSLHEEMLGNIKGRTVRIIRPKKGEKFRLIKMAEQNAEQSLKEVRAAVASDTDLLVRLQKRLKMNRTPWRIECFDNSNISGTAAVAGMVVFEKGKPNTSLYRKYKIKTVASLNDYAFMAEVLRRRYGRGEKSKPFPDILIVDGGKGHLNIAVSVIRSLGLEHHIQIIAIAKKDDKKRETHDKVYMPGRANAVNLGKQGDLLLFLQRIRDESHRFALSFHRKRRRKAFIRSELDTIPGIGKKRKAMLLKHFKSIKKVRAATLEELSALPGINRKLAQNVQKSLNANSAK
jgi:excinuclease ABC subunit C